MHYYYPDYFDSFRCVGGMECPDSCCHIWQITVDKKTLKKYNKVKGELGRRMREKIDTKTGNIKPHGKENRCEFLNDDNLCDIVLELGEDYLCHTCHTHPRHEEVYHNVRERSLAITCPVACKELLMRKTPVTIQIKKDRKRDFFDRHFDSPLYVQLAYIRDSMLRLIQNRQAGIFKRMVLILGMAHDVQRRIRKRQSRQKKSFINKIFQSCPDFLHVEKEDIKKIAAAYRDISVYSKISMHMIDGMLTGFVKRSLTDMVFTLCTMEPLKNTWLPYLQSIINIRTQMADEEYDICQKEFNRKITSIQLEQMLFYFAYLYCCTATYDGLLLAKIKMAVVNTLLIRELWFMRWLEDNKTLSVDAQAEMAHWFVREVENSDENLEQWDSLMQRNPRFSLEILIKICSYLNHL